MKEIELSNIEAFSKIYNSNVNNKNIEKKIKQYGLDKVCIQQKIIDENPPSFNLELEETKRYDQKDSLRCWAFSGINVIKRNMANNLNMDIMQFELSDNFIAFFHRLEKANTTYEKILTSKTTDLNKIVKKNSTIRNIPNKMEDEVNDASTEYRIYFNNLEPIIYIEVVDAHIELYLRFLVHPKKQRNVENSIWLDILKCNREGKIELYKKE